MDKWLHFAAGALIAFAARPYGPTVALGLVAAAAVGKEALDWLRYGGPDWRDALATLAGGRWQFI